MRGLGITRDWETYMMQGNVENSAGVVPEQLECRFRNNKEKTHCNRNINQLLLLFNIVFKNKRNIIFSKYTYCHTMVGKKIDILIAKSHNVIRC